jgi:integrase/recombinase XerD
MKKFLKINEIHNLIELSAQKRRDFAFFHVSFSTGLRISDILRLKRKDFFDSDGEITRALTLKMKKTKGIITRPLRDDCREAVKRYLGLRDDANPYLFPAMANQHRILPDGAMSRISGHRIYKWYLSQMYPESELVGVSTHTARRSMGKIISERAGRIEPASKYLGHKSIASTQAYVDMDGHEEKANQIVGSLTY